MKLKYFDMNKKIQALPVTANNLNLISTCQITILRHEKSKLFWSICTGNYYFTMKICWKIAKNSDTMKQLKEDRNGNEKLKLSSSNYYIVNYKKNNSIYLIMVNQTSQLNKDLPQGFIFKKMGYRTHMSLTESYIHVHNMVNPYRSVMLSTSPSSHD